MPNHNLYISDAVNVMPLVKDLIFLADPFVHKAPGSNGSYYI